MDDFVIETEALTKRYGVLCFKRKTPALDALAIRIPRGSVYGFLGPNGAGKTTTIKLVMDLIKPSSGSVRVLGKPADDVQTKSRIGFLPDTPSFSPQLSAVEFLTICAKLLKIPSAVRHDRICEVLETVKMTAHAKSKLGSFSRGMLQRIGIAQAILNRPELLILDEPLLGLDPYGRQELKDIIAAQNAAGATIFFSSHILSDVAEICDHIAILNRGHLLCAGELRNLLDESGAQNVLRVTAPAAVSELVLDAASVVKKSDSLWEISFPSMTDSLKARIDSLRQRFPDCIVVSSAGESLDDFFFDAIKADNLRAGLPPYDAPRK